MATRASILEINGNRYDAVTGKLLQAVAAQDAGSLEKEVTRHQNKGGVIDGFIRVKAPQRAAVSTVITGSTFATKTTLIAEPTKLASNIRPAAQQTGVHAQRKVQRSKTLMRSVVSKPPAATKLNRTSSTIQTPNNQSVHQMSSTKQAMLHNSMDELRLRRASKVIKSEAIDKFSKATFPHKPSETTVKATTPEVLSKTLPLATQQSNVVHPLPSMIASATHGHLDQLIDNALHRATAHEAKPLKVNRFGFSKNTRFSIIGTSLCVLILVVAFFGYQNIPNIAMRIAASKSGLHASIPSYRPAGFAFSGPIHYGNGMITLHYVQNGNQQRDFSIIQRSSAWDSESLLSNFVSNSRQYQTFQDHGKTVYIFNDQNATWVNQGIWYTVESQARLNSDQLLHIASSM